ncbi:MAG: hypothetical protein Q9157_009111, partial [Trypethelium eluteriae]
MGQEKEDGVEESRDCSDNKGENCSGLPIGLLVNKEVDDGPYVSNGEEADANYTDCGIAYSQVAISERGSDDQKSAKTVSISSADLGNP